VQCRRTYVAEEEPRERCVGRGPELEETPEQRRGGCGPHQRRRMRSRRRGARGRPDGRAQQEQAAGAGAGGEAGGGHWVRPPVVSSRRPLDLLLVWSRAWDWLARQWLYCTELTINGRRKRSTGLCRDRKQCALQQQRRSGVGLLVPEDVCKAWVKHQPSWQPRRPATILTYPPHPPSVMM
jgi:hypothetical protein